MADLPILFNAPMIRALLREIEAPGTGKTQTRRIIKPQPFIDEQGNFCAPGKGGKVWNWGQHMDGSPCVRNFIPEVIRRRPGDRLWCRETWAVKRFEPCLDHEREWQSLSGPVIRYAADGAEIQYRGDRATGRGIYHGPVESGRPSIHMPRWASRLTLYVTEVRVERLQDISEADARAEGAELFVPGHGFITEAELRADPGYSNFLAPRMGFETIWTEINGPDSWAENPFVAAYTFRPVLGNIDTLPATLQEAA